MNANTRGLLFLGAFTVAPVLVMVGLVADSLALAIALPLALALGAGLFARRGATELIPVRPTPPETTGAALPELRHGACKPAGVPVPTGVNLTPGETPVSSEAIKMTGKSNPQPAKSTPSTGKPAQGKPGPSKPAGPQPTRNPGVKSKS